MRNLSVVSAVLLAVSGCRSEAPVEDPVVLDDASSFEFPLELWDRGVEGEAVVRLRVTSAGIVDSALIHESSGEPALDEAAIAGALELRFDPARQADRPVDAWVRLPVRFTREGEAELSETRSGS